MLIVESIVLCIKGSVPDVMYMCVLPERVLTAPECHAHVCAA